MVQTTLPFGLFTPKRSSNLKNKSNGSITSKSDNKSESDLDSHSTHKKLKLKSPPKSSPKSLTSKSKIKSEKENLINKRKFEENDNDDIEIIDLKFNDDQDRHDDHIGNNFGQLPTPSSLKKQKRNITPTPIKLTNKGSQNSMKSEVEEDNEDDDDSNMYDSDSSLSSVGSAADTSECLEAEDIALEDKENTTPDVENGQKISGSSKSETSPSKKKSKKKVEDPEKLKAKLEERRLKKLKLEQEKLEKNQKKEEEARIREEKKRQIELEKQKKKEELEKKRKEKEELEMEKKKKREEAEAERKKKKEELEKEKKLKEMRRLQEKEEKELKKLQEKEEKELKRLQEKEEKEQQKLQEEEKRKREQEKKKKQQITSFFKIVKSNEKDPSSLESNDSSNGVNHSLSNNSSIYSGNDSVLNILSANSMKISDSAVSNDNTNNGVSGMNNTNNSSPVKKRIYAYKDYFLEFYIKSNSKIINNLPSFEETENRKISFDTFLASNVSEEQSFNKFLNSSECNINNNSKDYKIISSTDVIQTINMGLSKEAQQLITKVNVKYLQFYENAKPAYCGTYSKCINDCDTELQFAPYTRLPSTDKFTLDYEFDSDLEGDNDEDNDEEGDLIDSHDEEEDDDDDDEDMDEDEETNDKFLVEDDDEKKNGASSKNKRKIAGPLIPVVKWFGMKSEDTDQSDILMQNIDYFDNLQYERLHTKIDFPIDPLRDYWADISEAESKANAEISKEERSSKSDNNEKNKKEKNSGVSSAAYSSNNSSTTSPLKKSAAGKQDQTNKGSNESEKEVNVLTPKKQKKFISDAEDLKQLVDFISKNDAFSITTLTELFQMTVINHKYSKVVVRNSIQNVASFDQQKKKWAIN